MWKTVRSIVDKDQFSSWANIVRKEINDTKTKYPFLEASLESMYTAKFSMNILIEKMEKVTTVTNYFF
jgi:hypothetical protein